MADTAAVTKRRENAIDAAAVRGICERCGKAVVTECRYVSGVGYFIEWRRSASTTNRRPAITLAVCKASKGTHTLTPGYFRDLKQQIIDAILCERPEGLALLWQLAERQCSDDQLRELRTAARQAREALALMPEEILAR